MSQVVILGDLHLGARAGAEHFGNYFNSFFTDVLYPYCEKNNVKHIIQLGDCFDNRTSLQFKSFHRSKDIWFKQMGDLGINMTLLLGNHDICYRHTLSINSPELLLGEYEHINVINTPTQIKIGSVDFDIIPWICDENEDEIKKFVARKDRGQVLLGHLELAGFPMYRGAESHGGKESNLFDQYGLVFSGHFHTRSEKGNIIYTGIPYEITWSDYADPKGFYVYDTDKNTYEFIRNPNTIFEKIIYNNGSKFKISSAKDKIIKIVTVDKTDSVAYERWLDSIKLALPYELKIIENESIIVDGEIDETIEFGDTPSLIKNFIDQIETSVEKDDLNKYMQTLYNEATAVNDSI